MRLKGGRAIREQKRETSRVTQTKGIGKEGVNFTPKERRKGEKSSVRRSPPAPGGIPANYFFSCCELDTVYVVVADEDGGEV